MGLSIEGAWHQIFDTEGVAVGPFNGRLLAWIAGLQAYADGAQDITVGEATVADQLVLSNSTDTAASANQARIGSKDIAAGNTTLHLETEGTGVIVAGTASTDSSISIYVNGVRYYLAASTSAPV